MEDQIYEIKQIEKRLNDKFSVMQEAISVLYEQNAKLLLELKRMEKVKCLRPITIDEKEMARCEYLLKKSKAISNS